MNDESPVLVMISHAPTCPVAQPEFVPTGDRSSACTCDFMERLKALLDPEQDRYREAYRHLTRDLLGTVLEWHELPETERYKWRCFLDGEYP